MPLPPPLRLPLPPFMPPPPPLPLPSSTQSGNLHPRLMQGKQHGQAQKKKNPTTIIIGTGLGALAEK